MERRTHSTDTRWERQNGYARAVRVGPLVFVSGTLAADEHGNVLHPGSAALQTTAALQKIARALQALDAGTGDVVRTRLYVTDIATQDEVGAAHKAFFGQTRPACTLVAVAQLASPTALVEVEAEAVVVARPERRADFGA